MPATDTWAGNYSKVFIEYTKQYVSRHLYHITIIKLGFLFVSIL